ncbi:TFCP2 [Acanthosepion pharaonis]|uniref:TFCP2 n=1 Tax=Acanthosepion pharaonis TaxID=158019 RepID=A0A812BL09_ACAPH|nr:TFCP2 [Sepia pharaonis]
MAASRRESYPRFVNQSMAIRPHTSVDISCQMTDGLQNSEKNTLMTPTWRSTLSSRADSGRGWSEGDTGHAEEMADQLIPQFCKPQGGQVNKMDKRHIEGNFSYPNESTTISARWSSWPDVPTTMINDPNFGRSAEEMAASRRESYPRFMNQTTAIRPQSSVDINCQMTPEFQNGNKNTLMIPYCPTWRSTLSSHADSGHGWSEGDTGHAEEMTDQLIPQFCKPQREQFNRMDKRHIEGKFSYPNESTTLSARLEDSIRRGGYELVWILLSVRITRYKIYMKIMILVYIILHLIQTCFCTNLIYNVEEERSPGSSWPDVPTTMINDPNFGRHAEEMAASRRESYPRFINQSTAIRPNSTVDINCQMTSGLQNGGKNTLMAPNCPTWRSTLSSHADSGHGWSEGDTGHAEEMTDQLIPQFCRPQIGQKLRFNGRNFTKITIFEI